MKHRNNIPLNFKEKSNSKISLTASVIVLLLLFALFRQIDYNLVQKPAKEAAIKAEKERIAAEEAANAPVITSVKVAAVGDNTVYSEGIYESGQHDPENWNYDHLYENIKSDVQAADLSIVTQTTVLSSDHETVSNYYITPSEVGDALVNAGFNVIAGATNSVDDFGKASIEETIQYWKNNQPDVSLLGLHETAADAGTITTLTINDISIALLNYTYGTNKEDNGFMVDLFDKETIAAAVSSVSSYDCIIMVAHWGDEYTSEVSEYQKQWAAYLMDLGVDVLIGSHPHVLQPYGRLSDDKGNEMLVFYSLGNFICTSESLNELLGGMASFTIEKTVQNDIVSIKLLTPSITPMVMHYNSSSGIYTSYMLEDYSDDLAYSHEITNYSNDFTLENLNNRFKEIMSENVVPSTGTDQLEPTPAETDTSDEEYDEYDEYDEYSEE